MRHACLGLIVVAMVMVPFSSAPSARARSSAVARPVPQIMGDLPTVVDTIEFDGESLSVDFRIVEGLYNAASQGGVNLSFLIELTLSDGEGRTFDFEPKDDPLVEIKAIGSAVEGMLPLRISLPWDGKDANGNTLTDPIRADYSSAILDLLPSGKVKMIGTETSGSLTVQ